MRFLTILILLNLSLMNLECHAAAEQAPTTKAMPWLLLLMDEMDEPNLTFTFTPNTAGQFNSLPAGATSVRVTCQGQTKESSTSPLTFSVPLGATTFTAKALDKDGNTVKTMGPIQLTMVKGFPLTIPLVFALDVFLDFDSYYNFVGNDNSVNIDTYISYLSESERLVQYGGTGPDQFTLNAGVLDDWLEQYGGDGDDTLSAYGGSTGDDFIHQEGGGGIDLIGADGGSGNDTVSIDGGTGNDIIVYRVSSGTDTATIKGGDGTDALTVNNTVILPMRIQDNALTVLYEKGAGGGTTITVSGIEQIVVTEDGSTPVFIWP